MKRLWASAITRGYEPIPTKGYGPVPNQEVLSQYCRRGCDRVVPQVDDFWKSTPGTMSVYEYVCWHRSWKKKLATYIWHLRCIFTNSCSLRVGKRDHHSGSYFVFVFHTYIIDGLVLFPAQLCCTWLIVFFFPLAGRLPCMRVTFLSCFVQKTRGLRFWEGATWAWFSPTSLRYVPHIYILYVNIIQCVRVTQLSEGGCCNHALHYYVTKYYRYDRYCYYH